MKQLTILFLMILLMSCAPSMTELWVEKDGSGKMECTFDLGSMMSMMEMAFKSEEDNTESQDSMMVEEENELMDSTIHFYDVFPDSVLSQLSNPEQLKNISMRIAMDKSKEEAFMKMNFNYKDQEDLKKTMMTMMDARAHGDGAAGMAAMATEEDLQMMFVQANTDIKNKVIRIPRIDIVAELQKSGELTEEMMNDIDSIRIMKEQADMSEDGKEMMMMMEMMFGNQAQTVVHAPGQILFTNDSNAKIDGNKVVFTDNSFDRLIAGDSLTTKEWLIKYK